MSESPTLCIFNLFTSYFLGACELKRYKLLVNFRDYCRRMAYFDRSWYKPAGQSLYKLQKSKIKSICHFLPGY